jgi:pyruvate/2-oxoglutarate dehydrogenase complex dihydrolipoamide dehydrogenase (E3) component
MNVNGDGEVHKLVTVEYECQVKRIWKPDEFAKSGLKEESIGSTRKWNVFAELTNGKSYGCDLVVSATGVVPNGDAICPGMFEVDADDGGIVVDDNLRTSVEDVYAAGDVCYARWVKDPPTHWFQGRKTTEFTIFGHVSS